ncbi:AbrB/MazE/SpoVT family DNA-binding domain-containing protein [Desulfonatronum sp. SC1]|uniref:AbrB/MazE/SpoVT family DNA-binding domain-containing protein n=1 Tax=Desulfonatronum sp. SC1 TaxID=2109626 RepID=UPI000D30940E|nr:AbrB/MazE/SpoVT family DNA-binding domain-containing protein [Desulfonatronum sp. SC1]PTN32167.1 transcriptional regulator [Desulfonatronum sp. SC1]
MTTLTVTTKGQVILRKKILEHLGVEPGQNIEVDQLPGGRIEVRAARPNNTIDAFLGLLSNKTNKKVATIEEIGDAATEGWAGRP